MKNLKYVQASNDESVDGIRSGWGIGAAVIISFLFNILGVLASPIYMLIAAAFHTALIIFTVKKGIATWAFLIWYTIVPVASVIYYLLTRIVY